MLEFSIEIPVQILQAMGDSEKKAVEVVGIARVLKLGMNGEDVKLLQLILGVSADGDFGLKTESALVAFQIKKGLTPDGVLGAKTRTVLAQGNKPTGCTATTVYSPTTGARCSFVN